MFKGLLPIKSAEKYIFIAVRAQQAVFTFKSKGGIESLESNVPAPAWIWIYPSQNLKGFKEPQVSQIHDYQSI